MYILSFRDGTKINAYYRELNGKGYFVDEQGFELKDEDVIWCEKI